ncbi:hypothetical protein [Shimia biformata]|uniref:hypothetical protein n=1 Tax=Shimia biformata TaxID=1294299 RepID=UPI001EF3AB3F|nr:hypothetical protein [Shimia biformata]
MTRTMLWGLGGYFLASGVFMWVAPQLWYDTVPGVKQTGGFNAHFIADVALSFGVSAVAIGVAAQSGDRRLALFGIAFPACHAVFHLWIWIAHRGMAADQVALVNLMGIQLPGWIGLAAALKLGNRGAAA